MKKISVFVFAAFAYLMLGESPVEAFVGMTCFSPKDCDKCEICLMIDSPVKGTCVAIAGCR